MFMVSCFECVVKKSESWRTWLESEQMGNVLSVKYPSIASTQLNNRIASR